MYGAIVGFPEVDIRLQLPLERIKDEDLTLTWLLLIIVSQGVILIWLLIEQRATLAAWCQKLRRGVVLVFEERRL